MPAPSYTPPPWSPTKGAHATTSSPRHLEVTTLAPSGEGSFHHAYTKFKEPRVITFHPDLAGVIGDGSRFIPDFGEVTIIGSPRICLRSVLSMRGKPAEDGKPGVKRTNIILSGLTIRQGGHLDCVDTTELEGLLVDKCSIGWGGDELLTVYYNSKRIALTRNLFTEPLSNVGHEKGSHGYGVMIGDNNEDVLIAGNAFGWFQRRGPQVGRSKRVLVANNLMYDWAAEGICTNITRSGTEKPSDWTHDVAVVRNQYIHGRKKYGAIDIRYPLPGSKIYLFGNRDEAGRDIVNTGSDGFKADMVHGALPPYTHNWPLLQTQDVEEWVLANAGSGEPHDKRVKANLKARKGSQPVDLKSFSEDPYKVYSLTSPAPADPKPVDPPPTPSQPATDWEKRAKEAESKLTAIRAALRVISEV